MVRLSKEQKAKTRNSILEVSKKHFLEDGYDNTKTKDIAKEVGIAEGTLFNYFDSKADLFLQSLTEGYIMEMDVKEFLNYNNGITEIIYEFLYSTMKNLIIMPKKIIREILSASILIAKKNHNLMHKLADLDYNLIHDLEEIIRKLIENKRFKECDTKIASESIYSVGMIELMIYVYEDDMTKEKMLENVKNKIQFILQGHIL